jgi:hypothetical protein
LFVWTYIKVFFSLANIPGLMYKLKGPDGSSHVVKLEPLRSTFADLQSAVQEKTGILVAAQKLSFGFPPAVAACEDPTAVLATSIIPSGNMIAVKLVPGGAAGGANSNKRAGDSLEGAL